MRPSHDSSVGRSSSPENAASKSRALTSRHPWPRRKSSRSPSRRRATRRSSRRTASSLSWIAASESRVAARNARVQEASGRSTYPRRRSGVGSRQKSRAAKRSLASPSSNTSPRERPRSASHSSRGRPQKTSRVVPGLEAVSRREHDDHPALLQPAPVEHEAPGQLEGEGEVVEARHEVVAGEGERARAARVHEDRRRAGDRDLDVHAVVEDAVRGLVGPDLAALGLVEGGDGAGEDAAAGARELGEAAHVLEERRAGHGAAEAEAVERVVDAPREVLGEGARGTHALPERLEGEAGQARGQDLEVEVEAQSAAGESVEEGPGLERRPPQLEEGERRLGRERHEADVEGALARALDARAAGEDVGGGLLEVVDDLLPVRVEAEDAVPRALLEGGGLGEAEDGAALLGDARGVEVDDHVARRDDDLAAPPRVVEEEAELRVEHDRRQEGARGEGKRGEELTLGRVGGQPAALAARVDEQDALALEEGGRVLRPARLEQLLERPQRAAAGADAAGRGVGDDLEGELARVEARARAAARGARGRSGPAAPRRP